MPRPPTSGRWGAREAEAQALSRKERQAVAHRMRDRVAVINAQVNREPVPSPWRGLRASQIVVDEIHRDPEPLQVRLETRAPNPHPGGVVTGGGSWASNNGYTVSNGWANGGWTNVTFDWTPVRDGLIRTRAAIDDISSAVNHAAEAVAKMKPALCACGNPSDEHWEHDAEGCEFIPHQVQLGHVH